MKRIVCPLALILLLASTAALAASNERWLHVRVEETGPNAENVRVNVPLSLAEKVLPSLQADRIHNGKLRLEDIDTHGIDLRAVLAALRDLDDHEFVTVESDRENVRVAKSEGYLLVTVRETHERDGKAELETVDVQIPMTVVDAMLTGAPNELDLAAGVRALAALGDMVLVTVKERNSSVRIWVDSKSTTD
jgi:hypothetical protein